MVVQENQQRNSNGTSINMETKNQSHENLPQNSHFVTKLSPQHLSYPKSLVNIPLNEQNQPHYGSEPVSQPLYTVPQISDNHNLKTSDNLQNGTILSPMHLPYSLTPEAVPPPYPSSHGTWINGTWVTND